MTEQTIDGPVKAPESRSNGTEQNMAEEPCTRANELTNAEKRFLVEMISNLSWRTADVAQHNAAAQILEKLSRSLR